MSTSSHNAANHSRSFVSQSASPPLAPATPLLQELRLASHQHTITGLLQERTPILALASLQ
jgi:hypothetical protein